MIRRDMDWLYNNKNINEEDIPEDSWGFVYLITNQINGYRYIGKKLLTKSGGKKIVIKKDGTVSKKKAIQDRKISNWKSYYGSCKELTEDVKKFGKENFKREILSFHNGDARLSYEEAKAQIVYGALESEGWYNGMIKITAYKQNILGKE